MKSRTLKSWSFVHTWSSLICTVFILLSAITGLPLLFRNEIDSFLYEGVRAQEVIAGTPPANLDEIVARGMTKAPDEHVRFLIWDHDDPNVIVLGVTKSTDSTLEANRIIRMDAHMADYLDAPVTAGRFTNIVLRLHTELLAGSPGKLFLGAMGMLFVLAIISGVVLYAPSMRKLDFGTVRRRRSSRIHWLDIHNLIGATTLVWALVVGGTGVLNTLSDLVVALWQRDQLAAMVGALGPTTTPVRNVSVQRAVDVATAALPDMAPSFVAYPGTPFSSTAHFAIFMHGRTPLTSRLLQPVLVDASTGQLTDTRKAPWYVSALLLSQPLHFGDYGGLPLRILWALLDLALIVLLTSGIYLWLVRRKGNSLIRARESRRRPP